MPSNFLLPTIAVAVATLSLTLHAQDNSPISLERIVELHSQQLDRLKSASIVYDVTHVAQPGQAKSTESCRVIIDGPFEAYTTLPQDSVKPEYCWWDGTFPMSKSTFREYFTRQRSLAPFSYSYSAQRYSYSTNKRDASSTSTRTALKG